MQLKNNVKIKLVNHPMSTKNASSAKNAQQKVNFFARANNINNQIVKASRNYGVIGNPDKNIGGNQDIILTA
jgi:hypothetical protein